MSRTPHRSGETSLTRRGFLHTAALATAGAPAAGWTAERQEATPTPPRPQRIIVIGGGIAGLSCAYELVERGHDVTVLEASRRTGGHVKTLREELPGGLYADAGAERFTRPGYERFWRYVEAFDLPVLPWNRQGAIRRRIGGQWHTEEQLREAGVLTELGFHHREIDFLREHGWTELSRLYFDLHARRFKDEHDPFSAGLDELDQVSLGDWLASQGASDAAIRFCGGRRSTREQPTTRNDASALFHLWQAGVHRLRGLPDFPRESFRLKRGNQTLPDAFAERLGERIRRHSPVRSLLQEDGGVRVRFEENGRLAEVRVDQVVLCVSPLLLSTIKVTPAWTAGKAWALANVAMGMQSRVLFQTVGRFWERDLPGINLETGSPLLPFVQETAEEVEGTRRLLMGSGQPGQSAEETLAAFRALYPGQAEDTIERALVYQWWKEEPTCFGCERLPFPLGELRKIWPHLLASVGRLHFAGAAFDTLPYGMDAATRSAWRVAEEIGPAREARTPAVTTKQAGASPGH